jgi:4-diphosphocytidyl-2-C-methyl-D-erythritol kinase
MGTSPLLPNQQEVMRGQRTAWGLTVRAPAKVNLFLEVLGKRPDGYHDLATLMVAVGLFDTLEFKEDHAGPVSLELASLADHAPEEGRPSLGTGPENLVRRAAELLRLRTGHRGGVRIRLHKRIPLQAGLAGGSSDAAATLVGLNRLWRLGLGREELSALGAELGSDVAFFLGTPAAWCTGRGEIVKPLRPARPLWLVLACPPVGLSTADVFRALTLPETPADGSELCLALERGDLDAIAAGLFNRLQPAAEHLCPAVAEVNERLGRLGALGHLMSGSGTTLFALCRTHANAWRVADELDPLVRERMVSRTYVTRTCF